MKDGDDLKALTSEPVRNHVGCPRKHKRARAEDSSGTPKIRQPGQTFDSREGGHAIRAAASGLSRAM